MTRQTDRVIARAATVIVGAIISCTLLALSVAAHHLYDEDVVWILLAVIASVALAGTIAYTIILNDDTRHP